MRRTRIEIPLDKGRIMMGTVDETGVLEYGQVFVQYSSKETDESGRLEVLNGEVVIAKNPCFHPGDLRKFTAVDKPELRHMVDCVVFPSKGQRPHPDEMSGSDLDGDMYFVCWEITLIPPTDNEIPMDYTKGERQSLNHDITANDMINFIGHYIESDQVGVIANAHLVHADGQTEGIHSDQCIALAKLHSDAVDFPKTGQCNRIPFDLRPQSYPHYMQKRDKPNYTSIHVIAELFNQALAVEQASLTKFSADVKIDDMFLVEGYECYIEKANEIKVAYKERIQNMMKMHGIETEAELLTGHFLRINQRHGALLKKDSVEIAELIRLEMKALRHKIKALFFEEFGDGCENTIEVLKKASALYFSAYNEEIRESIGQIPSLPWLFVNQLIAIRKLNEEKSTNATRVTTPYWASMPHKLSAEISAVIDNDTTDIQLKDSRETKWEIYDHLKTAVRDLIFPAELVVFGSLVTGLDTSESTLDVFVKVTDADVETDVFSLVSEKLHEKFDKTKTRDEDGQDNLKFTKKFLDFNYENSNNKVCLFSAKDCLRQTAYTVASLTRNKWMLPVLRVLLTWARSNNIIDCGRDALLGKEQLTLMFLHYALAKCEHQSQISTSDIKTAEDLLCENHFLSCNVTVCDHLSSEAHISSDDDLSATIPGNALLGFFLHCSSNHGQGLAHFPDPCSDDLMTALLPGLKLPNQLHLGERMLLAYHSLAHSGSIHDFLNIAKIEGDHLTMALPRQVSSSIIFAEEYMAKTLETTCRADSVVIRRKRFPNAMAGLVLEAWGDSVALSRIREKIRNMEKMSTMFTKGSSSISRQFITDSYHTVFEGCKGPAAYVEIIPYDEECQPNHDRFEKQVPRLKSPDQLDTYDKEAFVNFVMQQTEFIAQNYDNNLHGELRSVISYGGYYLIDCKQRELTVKEFEDKANDTKTSCNSGFINRDPRNFRRGGGRRGGRGGYRGPQAPPSYHKNYIHHAFIPSGQAKFTSLKKYLEAHNFVETESRQEYRASVKMMVSEHHTNMDGVLVLDENFKFKHLHLPDTKWLVVDVIRNRQSCKDLEDFRFKIHTRVTKTHVELVKQLDCVDLLKDANKILIKLSPQYNVIGINADYINRVRFLRHKNLTVYEHNGNPHEHNKFLCGLKIRVNRGKEFTRPSREGIFTSVDANRIEVTILPTMPDLHNQAEFREFLEKVWNFSRELGFVMK